MYKEGERNHWASTVCQAHIKSNIPHSYGLKGKHASNAYFMPGTIKVHHHLLMGKKSQHTLGTECTPQNTIYNYAFLLFYVTVRSEHTWNVFKFHITHAKSCRSQVMIAQNKSYTEERKMHSMCT
jgi:hypothetical protein